MKDYTNEELIAEWESCFDEEGNPIDSEKLKYFTENTNILKLLFSKERLTKIAQNKNFPLQAASAERFLNKCFYPDNYWEMPDYYYPGIKSEELAYMRERFQSVGDYVKILFTTTRNEAVLIDAGWHRELWNMPEYFNDNIPDLKLIFDKNEESVKFVKINPETKEEISKAFEIPFGLLCGMFLKCREMEFSKPKELRAHDLKDRFPDTVKKIEEMNIMPQSLSKN